MNDAISSVRIDDQVDTGTDRVRERRYQVYLLLIILVGFGIRASGLVWGQAYLYFGQGDAVEAFSTAVNYGLGETRAQYLGQPNYNAHSKLPGPLWTVFCFAAYRVWGSVEGIVWATILLNTAVIFVNYELARRLIGSRAGLLSALFTAVFPWVVYYSNTIYNPDVMAFLGALLFLALWNVVKTDRSKSIFWAVLVLFMLPQFHMAGVLMAPAVILVLALSPTRIHVWWLAAGILAGCLLYAPYLRGEMTHGWQNTRGMFIGGEGAGYSVEGLKAISAPLSFLVNWGPRWVRTAAEYRELGRACFGSFGIFLALNLISAILAALLLAGAFLEIKSKVAGFWRFPRKVFREHPQTSFLCILLITPLLIATVLGKPFHTRYCVMILPLLMAVASLGALRWIGRPGPARQWFLAALIITCCADVWLMPAMYRVQGKRIQTGPVFVPSFRQLDFVYHRLKEHAGNHSAIRVEADSYVHSLSPQEKNLKNAVLIQRYIDAREKESKSGTDRVCTYELRRTGEGSPASTVAYDQHGITLVMVSGF